MHSQTLSGLNLTLKRDKTNQIRVLEGPWWWEYETLNEWFFDIFLWSCIWLLFFKTWMHNCLFLLTLKNWRKPISGRDINLINQEKNQIRLKQTCLWSDFQISDQDYLQWNHFQIRTNSLHYQNYYSCTLQSESESDLSKSEFCKGLKAVTSSPTVKSGRSAF